MLSYLQSAMQVPITAVIQQSLLAQAHCCDYAASELLCHQSSSLCPAAGFRCATTPHLPRTGLESAWNTSIATPRDRVAKHDAPVQHSACPQYFGARAALRMSYTGLWGPAAVKALMAPANSGPLCTASHNNAASSISARGSRKSWHNAQYPTFTGCSCTRHCLSVTQFLHL